MKRKILAGMLATLIVLTMTACKEEGNEVTTTVTGMVVSVDGTVISLMEMDAANRGGADFAGGERPEMPEGMEGFQGGDFDPENMPEGFSFPQGGSDERPTMPEGMTPPEGMTIPENGQMPNFGGRGENGEFNMENFVGDGETKTVDIGDAHISVEIDGGKASGSLDDIKAGTFVTITMNGKGEVTNVLVSSQSLFGGGGRRPTN